MKYLVICGLVILNFTGLKASYKSDIYNAYINSDLRKWKKVIDEMEALNVKSNDYMLELLNYQYGYIAWNVGNKKYDEAEKYIKLGDKYIEILEKNKFQFSSVNSYKSAFYGFKIVMNTFQAFYIGQKCITCAKMAVKLDINNPFAYIQLGNTKYYLPAFFGGSKTKAIEYYAKAIKLMESDKEQIKEDWNYLNLLTMIALAYKDLKYYKTAKAYFEKILLIEPNFKWVKEDLYPKL